MKIFVDVICVSESGGLTLRYNDGRQDPWNLEEFGYNKLFSWEEKWPRAKNKTW